MNDFADCQKGRPERPAPEVYGVIAEFPSQGPILMESEGPWSSEEAARERTYKLKGAIRTAVVRLTYASGNELLLLDMQRMQK